MDYLKLSEPWSEAYLNHTVFAAMGGDESDNDYLANVAMGAAEVLRYERYIEENKNKNNSDSEYHREEGNKVYKRCLLQKALISYNKALAYAPNGSLALKLAYSNRSAVLFSAKEYEACVIDCKLALAIDCPTAGNLTKKLRKRLLDADAEEKKLNLMHHSSESKKFSEDYFRLKSKNNEIPCASTDVAVDFDSKIPKVVAKNDIPSGTLVAVEKAFVSWVSGEPDTEQYISCHYCRKLYLNLIPCSGCVVAMFCSKQCEESCSMEYHNVECQIIGKLPEITTDSQWLIKILIKQRNMCSSWNEFVSMSVDYGYNRIRKSTPKEMYDVDNPLSVLSFKDDRHFLHGALYRAGIMNGIFLNILQNVKPFMPEDLLEKISAIKAMARVLMYLALYCRTTILPLVTRIKKSDSIGFYKQGHRGLFPFVGKLKNCCMPNLQMLAGNNTVALIAVEPIKAGTELTVSHVFHWLEHYLPKHSRRMNLMLGRLEVCTCFVCNATPEEWAQAEEETNSKASPAQRKAATDCFTFDHYRMFGIPLEACFEQIYKSLALLKDIKVSVYYKKVYNEMINFQLHNVQNKFNNVILSGD